MPGPPPKPDSQRVRRNRPAFDWVILPAEGRKGRAPKLPPVRDWSPETLRWWKDLWRSPQSTQWDQTGRSAVPMAVLYDVAQKLPERSAAIFSELRNWEDRHGLNPKAMLSLRWRIEEPEVQPDTEPQRRLRDRRATMRLLGYEGDPDAG